MWDLLHQTMHIVAQVGNDASAVASEALTTAVQAAPDAVQAAGAAVPAGPDAVLPAGQALSAVAQTAPDAAQAAGQALSSAAQGGSEAALVADPGLVQIDGQATPEAIEAAQALMQVAQAGPDAAQPEQDMGMLSFIAQSDLVGKTLFGLLVFMSVLSWYLIFAKFFVNMSRRARTRKFLKEFWTAESLEDVERRWAIDTDREPFSRLARHAISARNHHARYGGSNLEESGSTAAFVTRSMRKIIDEETARLENGLTVLASIGSTAPFVGLFGTVWGVYHALIGIGMSDGMTVNSIAGPVGEALIMTGLGLAVAIPAVLAYNGFVRSNRVYLAKLDTFAHDLFSFLSTGQPITDQPPRAGQPDLRVASGGM